MRHIFFAILLIIPLAATGPAQGRDTVCAVNNLDELQHRLEMVENNLQTLRQHAEEISRHQDDVTDAYRRLRTVILVIRADLHFLRDTVTETNRVDQAQLENAQNELLAIESFTSALHRHAAAIVQNLAQLLDRKIYVLTAILETKDRQRALEAEIRHVTRDCDAT